ncbi:MAG: DNA-directed DNA polymerase II small subunit [Thermoplasmatota archaeon]
MRKRIVSKLAERNTVLTPEAWEYLDRFDEPISIVENVIEVDRNLPFPLGRDTLENFVEVKDEKEVEKTEDNRDVKDKPDDDIPERRRPEPDDIKVLKDISGESTCTGVIDDFKEYFLDRYKRLRAIISKRREAKGISDIDRVAKRSGNAKVIGMVGDIHNTANGNKMLTLEDPTGKIKAFISSDSEAFDKNLLEDEVVLAEGQIWEKKDGYDTTFAVDDIIRPGIPKIKKMADKNFDGKIAFIGDIHVGSDTFLKDEWDRFTGWLNSDDEVAQDIRYLVITGDLIDGIGIFPNQEEELEIIDIYEQYRELARMLTDVPDDVLVITIPGNHDIVRNTEPQPKLPEDVRKLFPDNVVFYGNPCLLDIEGLKLLLYHGSSINDLSDLHPDVSNHKPITAMKEMMKRRHLVPVYGKKTSIAPEDKDYLLIEDIPDVFVTGHIHRTEVEDYHGTIMINSSTWQSQTEYQKMRDIEPDPAKVMVLDPTENQVSIQNFSS